MKSLRAIGLKFTVFAVVTVSATVFLFMTFAQYRTGRSNGYSAVFADASRLKPGDSVRAAGIRIGTVDTVTLRADNTALVTFEADRDVVLTTATKAAVRYLNLVGDRYLELVDAPGSAAVMPAGSQIPVDRTQPALDLDLLLSGLKPVIASLSPQDVNALTSALVHILQGEGGTVESLFAKTSSFTNALADNDGVIRELIENLKVVLSSLTTEGGDRFSTALDRVEKLITGFAGDRDPVGAAIDALDAGTASLAGLLASARPPLAGGSQRAQPAGPTSGPGQGKTGSRTGEGPGQLPQAHPPRGGLRQFHRHVRVRHVGAGDRPGGPYRGLPVDQADRREVRRAVMVKYRGASLIRAGFIGVSVAVLVVLVGLAPQRLTSWATQVRYQAVFPEAGGLVTGNDVLVSGIKVGTVSDVSLLRGGMRWSRSPSTGRCIWLADDCAHQDRNGAGGAHRDTCSGGCRHAETRRSDSSFTHVIALRADRCGRRSHRQRRGGDRHRIVEPVSADLVGHGRCDGAATGTHVGWADPAVAIDEQS